MLQQVNKSPAGRPQLHNAEPAASVIRKLGGNGVVRQLCNVRVQTLTRWRTPKPVGSGGSIPQRYHRLLLSYARLHDIELTANDLLPPE